MAQPPAMDPKELLAQLVALVGASAVQPGEALATQHLSDWSGAPPVRPLARVCRLTPGKCLASWRGAMLTACPWCHRAV